MRVILFDVFFTISGKENLVDSNLHIGSEQRVINCED